MSDTADWMASKLTGETDAQRAVFGTLADGTRVDKAVLRNGNGIEAEVIGWGAALRSLSVPDRDGWLDDVVLGYETLGEYVAQPEFFGATVGRFANRIAAGLFKLDGRDHAVAATDGPNALHGGLRGFDKHNWTLERVGRTARGAEAWFRRVSRAGEEGFPGTLDIAAGYVLGDDDTLTLEYRAETDAPTIVNLCNHTYFNLAGESAGVTALEHTVVLHADSFTPVDETMIPTGEIRSVTGTPFDFRDAMRVCDHVRDGHDTQIRLGRGYDHNFLLRGGRTAEPKPAVVLLEPNSGRRLEIATTEPGLQFYSGNFLNGTRMGKGGRLYRQGDGLCFETQHFPDSPNRPNFPSVRLDPGQIWQSRTVWRFGIG